MITRRFVRIRSLKEGMKIDQTIKNQQGCILIARGTVMDEYLIDSLKKLQIAGVYICEGEEDPDNEEVKISKKAEEKIEKLMVSDRSKVKLSESVKKQSGGGGTVFILQYGFSGF